MTDSVIKGNSFFLSAVIFLSNLFFDKSKFISVKKVDLLARLFLFFFSFI